MSSLSPRVALAYEYIRERIVNGTFPVEENIPRLIDIADELDVSSDTVVAACKALRAAGFLIRSGRGTMVCDRKFWPEAARRPEHTSR